MYTPDSIIISNIHCLVKYLMKKWKTSCNLKKDCRVCVFYYSISMASPNEKKRYCSSTAV